MHQGLTACARIECCGDIDIIVRGELVTFLGELSNVIQEGLTQLLLATLQIPGVARSHVCALEVAYKDPLKILLAINHISRKVVELSPGRVGGETR
jgi:hypothetical protein